MTHECAIRFDDDSGPDVVFAFEIHLRTERFGVFGNACELGAEVISLTLNREFARVCL